MNSARFFISVTLGLFILLPVNTTRTFSRSKELTLAIGLALPPYNISETSSGIEFDIVKEALKMKGYTIKPKYVPQARRNRELINREVDGVLTINPDSGVKAFYSDEHIVYQNVVVSLKKNKFAIEDIEDLNDKSVVAFQQATTYLGKDFADMAKANKRYKEIADQKIQINLLYGGRVDTIVLDKNIFHYLRKRGDRVDTTQPTNIHRIFAPTHYRVAFLDKKVRDDFNEGLRQLHRTGRYEAIIKKYLPE
ncbi:MAG: transporter substrate-binding domain-containing protein [Desulfobacteraceae bacterium]|nr:transporter substrate-binding domain-containing protein [Desulfobacteraceae bacterium]